ASLACDTRPLVTRRPSFRQEVQGADHPRFSANNVSDGTVRALGILLALHQVGNGAAMPLIGIEEPETALHPAAIGVLTDGLRDAAERTQVVVTSHSPELLDDPEVPDGAILAVLAESNETRLGPLDAAGRETLREHLYTAGELLRMGQLRPDPALSQPRQLELFEGGAEG
ncbi:MAG: AAA family ATPase, partial [Planctomycetota bacterium]